MKFYLLFLSFVTIVFGCNPDRNIKLDYYSTGTLKSIKRYNQNEQLNGESIWFTLQGSVRHLLFFKNGKEEGPSYYFYPSGSLQAYRFYHNGKEINMGYEYYDHPLIIIKVMLYFNDSGQIYYKRSFDEHGRFLREEGNKPASVIH